MRIPEKHLLQLYWLHQSLCVDHNKLFSLVAQSVKSLPAMWEIWVLSLGQGKPLRRKWLPTLVLLPREFHQQRALVGYSSWGHEGLDPTGWLNNNNSWRIPPKEEPGGHSVTGSRTWLKWLHIYTHNNWKANNDEEIRFFAILFGIKETLPICWF